MTTFLLVLSMLLCLGALGVLVRTIVSLVADLKQTTRVGAESGARIKAVVAGIREEMSRLRDDLTLLTGAATAWPRAAVLPREAGLLARNIRSFGAAAALLSTLRRAPW